MNEEEKVITANEHTAEKIIKPKRTMRKSFGNVTKSVTIFKNRKMPTGIRCRLSTRAFRITTPKSQSLKARSFLRYAGRRKSLRRSLLHFSMEFQIAMLLKL